MGYLDNAGLSYFYNKIKNKFALATHSHSAATTSANGFMSSGDKTTLNRLDRESLSLVPRGTAIVSNKNLNTTEFIKVGKYYCSANAIVATLTNCPTASAFMMEVYSPLSTTYDNETTSQWVYRLRKLTTFTGEEYTQSISSGATAGTFTYGAWKRTDTDTTYSVVTTSANGLMSSGDKTKLNGIATGATKNTITSTTGTLTVAGWSNKSQTINISGVTTTNLVLVSINDIANGIKCSAQGSGNLTFTCETVPTANVAVNVATIS